MSALRRRQRRRKEQTSEHLQARGLPTQVKDTRLLKPFLEEAIASLPPKSKMVFVLHDVQGFQHQEIAQMLNCSVGTSKSQLHKARSHLRKTLRSRLSLISDMVNVPVGEA